MRKEGVDQGRMNSRLTEKSPNTMNNGGKKQGHCLPQQDFKSRETTKQGHIENSTGIHNGPRHAQEGRIG